MEDRAARAFLMSQRAADRTAIRSGARIGELGPYIVLHARPMLACARDGCRRDVEGFVGRRRAARGRAGARRGVEDQHSSDCGRFSRAPQFFQGAARVAKPGVTAGGEFEDPLSAAAFAGAWFVLLRPCEAALFEAA